VERLASTGFGILRDRKVVQWVIAYAGVAWLLAQGLGLMADAFEWPAPVMRVALVCLICGVPAAAVIAWNHGGAGWRAPPRGEIVLLAAIVLATGLASVHFGGAAPPEAPPGPVTPPNSVAVLPFVNMTEQADSDYFSDGMTEELISTLGRVGGLKVAARSSAFQFKGTNDDVRTVGQKLGVATVIEGSVRRSADRLRISVQLVDAAQGHQIWSETYDRQLSDVFAVQEDIARSVVAALKITLSGKADRLVAQHPQSLEAYQAYLRGRYFWNKRDGASLLSAQRHFSAAVELDPTYALAYAGLADTYLLLPLHTPMSPKDAFARARAAAQRAIALDGRLAEGHTSLAYVLFWNDWDYAGAERAFRRAIDLNPNYPTAHHWFSEFLITSGEVEEAMREAAKAEELDPLSPIIGTDAAANFYFARRFEPAVTRLKRVLELDPDFQVARWYLGKSYGQMGRHVQGIAELEATVRASPDSDWSKAYLGYAYGAAGHRDKAQAVLNMLMREAGRRYVRSDILALLHLSVGDRDGALTLLERAVSERAIYPFIIARDPQFDTLRREPRFKALLREMRIPGST
jgi:TolB-like protein/Flp pilus assembly protein TadD